MYIDTVTHVALCTCVCMCVRVCVHVCMCVYVQLRTYAGVYTYFACTYVQYIYSCIIDCVLQYTINYTYQLCNYIIILIMDKSIHMYSYVAIRTYTYIRLATHMHCILLSIINIIIQLRGQLRVYAVKIKHSDWCNNQLYDTMVCHSSLIIIITINVQKPPYGVQLHTHVHCSY